MANHPLQNMITRAVITAIDTVRKCQTAGLKLIAGEKKENVEHLEPYGFTSAAQNGAEAVVLFPGGDRSHGVAVVVADRRFRLKGLARGEVALYDDQGQSVTLTRAGIVVNGGGKPVIFTNATKARFEMPIESTGDIRDNCDSSGKTMAEMRTTYNGHTHKENGDGGGNTDATIEQFQNFDSTPDPEWGEFWRYYWRVNIPADANISWQTCTSTCDSAIRTWGDTVAECVIDKLCPSHTVVVFAYPEGKENAQN